MNLKELEEFRSFCNDRGYYKVRALNPNSDLKSYSVEFDVTDGFVQLLFEEDCRYDPYSIGVSLSQQEVDMHEETWNLYLEKLKKETVIQIEAKKQKDEEIRLASIQKHEREMYEKLKTKFKD